MEAFSVTPGSALRGQMRLMPIEGCTHHDPHTSMNFLDHIPLSCMILVLGNLIEARRAALLCLRQATVMVIRKQRPAH